MLELNSYSSMYYTLITESQPHTFFRPSVRDDELCEKAELGEKGVMSNPSSSSPKTRSMNTITLIV